MRQAYHIWVRYLALCTLQACSLRPLYSQVTGSKGWARVGRLFDPPKCALLPAASYHPITDRAMGVTVIMLLPCSGQ